MSRVVTSLCSIPSFGTFGTPTFFGGPVGRSDVSAAPLSDDEITALDERATTTGTGGAMPSDRTPYYAGFQSNGVVWFDGFAALYGLALHAPSGSFSASYWFNPYEETTNILKGPQKHGCIFANSPGYLAAGPDGQFTPTFFGLRYTSVPPVSVASLQMPSIHNHTLNPIDYSLAVGWDIPSSDAVGYTTDPIDDMQGWCHVMYSQHVVGGQPQVQIYVNDTAILTNYQPATGLLYNDETWLFPFNAPTFTTFDGTLCPWTVGGVQVYEMFDPDISDHNEDLTLPAGDVEGLGLKGAIMEMWIAPGQYIDWSNSANRLLFHDTDITGTHWAPVNLGPKGATPTGTRPQYYFTGGPDKFPINRASGGHSGVWHRASMTTLEGTVDRLTAYSVLPF